VTDQEASRDNPEADAVAAKLGAISLGSWVAFFKMAVPSIAVAIPILLIPVNGFLDKREAAFKTTLLAELRPAGHAVFTGEKMKEIRKEVDALKAEIDDLEAEHKGDLRSSPTAIENMSRLADLRERVVRLEALAGIDSRR
jgi:hypothetical protein